MAGKWKHRAEQQAEMVENLHSQIHGLIAYQRTLQQHLEIAKRGEAQAREWAERVEKDNMAMRSQIHTLQDLLAGSEDA